MSTAAITLASLAALLEVWGIGLAVKDIRAARRRLAEFLETPGAVYGSAHGTLGAPRMTAHGTVEGQTLEQRVEALEAAQRALRDELDRRDQKVTERLSKQLQGALKSVEDTSDERFKKLRDYIGGSQQSFWASYRGPVVLAVGVIVGLAGNIFGAL
ncbi:hypothetical protein ACFW5I_10470 [Streptomyces sp. NPDC058818]|uniref:hypothetical protein n=1 Tax=Streptomyces sp. NPDC058818 TaxID=3346640 RepID=UPI0036CC188C